MKILKVKMAHFDGRYSGTPRGFAQIVELCLIIEDGTHEIAITFGRELLKGNWIEEYT